MVVNTGLMIILVGLGIATGLIGALLGLGGGIFLVPALTLGLGLPFPLAAGTSLVSVAATSAGGSSTYVRTRVANIRLGILLAIATVAAAVAASFLARAIDEHILRALFSVLLAYTGWTMLRAPRRDAPPPPPPPDPADDPWHLTASYTDARAGTVTYTPRRLPGAMGASLLGGAISGLLGVGGGIVQVPVMHLLMGMPLKAATATSSYLIGLTATASALVYYAGGRIDPMIAAPTALGIFAGARLGAYLGGRLSTPALKRIFGVVALLVALQMLLQTFNACPWCAGG